MRMYVMNRHFNNRAVSQIIAALLLIAIAVAAAILLYVFSIGLLGSLGTGGGSQTREQLILEAYRFGTSGMTVTLRNVGTSSINIGSADFFYAGVPQTNAPAATCTGTLTPTQGCSMTFAVIQPTAGSLVPNTAYPLKVVTPDGGVFSYAVIFQGTG